MNEEIIELQYEERLIFFGIWSLADLEGRLEILPK